MRRGGAQTATRLVTMVATVGAVTLLTVGQPARADDDDDDDEFGAVVPGEYVVELEQGADPSAIGAQSGALLAPEPLAPGSAVYRLVLDPTADPFATVSALENTPGVELVQPNFLSQPAGFLGRKRFFADLPVAVMGTDGSSYTATQAGLGGGLTASASGAGTTIAILDTGVDRSHPALAGSLAATGIDVIDGDLDPSEVADGIDQNSNGLADEGFGHGTFVAGVAHLVAPDATLLPARVIDSEGVTSTWHVMKGLAWATARGADVINLSLGGATLGEALAIQLDQIESSGVIVVAAAGNDASSDFVYPAAHDNVVAVTAVDAATAAPATFANFGSWIDVAAPGVAIMSTYPGGRYAVWGGTSAAAPIVAGALALIVERTPGAEADDRVSYLTDTSDANGLSGLSAYGRVDVAAAVARAGR